MTSTVGVLYCLRELMTTLETIEAMDEQSYAEISCLLSHGNVTLQNGGILTEKDFDALLDIALSTELGVIGGVAKVHGLHRLHGLGKFYSDDKQEEENNAF